MYNRHRLSRHTKDSWQQRSSQEEEQKESFEQGRQKTKSSHLFHENNYRKYYQGSKNIQDYC